jgi:stress-induced-phosphoprotein 1
MDLGNAMKDADKGLEIDPNFIKLYVRKGNVQNLMKAYHKALETFDKGLMIEPQNAELQAGKMRTQMSIQTGISSGGVEDKERMA